MSNLHVCVECAAERRVDTVEARLRKQEEIHQ